ncbi:MAG: hypothetical protein JRI95_17020 [Deltaproteobacteria bacterium]|nr:hypothetical protein [Deltaproteobacteria bacterium]
MITSTYSPGQGGADVTVFVRDDETGHWEIYRDKVTGIDRIFITIGVLGIFSGIYDASAPGKISWNEQSESGPVEIRPLAIIEVNNSLLFSAGKFVYRRSDGVSPTYTVVHDLEDLATKGVRSPLGGIRGMTAISNPNSEGESIIFAWCAQNRSRACIYRLDPDGKGGYTRVKETCLDNLISEYLGGNPVYFVLPAYNDILSVVDPSTKKTVNLIGFESWIGGQQFPLWMGKPNGGFYAGAMFAIRSENGEYRLNEVNGPIDTNKPVLVATRAYAISPFEEEDGSVIYFGGHDGNSRPSHNMAWIFKTSLDIALQ